MLGIQNEREGQSFCAGVLRQPEIADDPRFCTHGKHTDAILTELGWSAASLEALRTSQTI